MNIKEQIINESKRIGIDVIGFTSCQIAADMEDILKDRENKGYLSGFEEKDISLRINPGGLMENCKTIVSAGISYNIDKSRFAQEKTREFKASLSRASWGIDYHKVLKSKLEGLASFINTQFGGEVKVFVDTGPLLERDTARRAGIGYVGKNCSLINGEYGSYIFLGEILTDIYIEPDSPVDDDCGDCDLCIKACPAGALCQPYTVNAKKCISYLTQSRDISFENLQTMGSSIYGCDVCQAVCPKNSDIKTSKHDEFIPEHWNAYPDVLEILGMDNKTFEDTFKKASCGWRGKKNLQRNAIAVLANSGRKEALPHLLKALKDSRKDIRKVSILGLHRLMEKEAIPVLRSHLDVEKDDELRDMIIQMIDRD